MISIQKEQYLNIPKDVKITIKARKVKVEGPRGVLYKDLNHIMVAFKKINENKIVVSVYQAGKKHVASLQTVVSLINNMIDGVTKGFKYKMRYAYAHFPINVNIVEKEGDKFVEIRNFLGEKRVRSVKVHKGIDLEISKLQKDELILTGISLENVSQSAADIQQACRIRKKDIRKFLDGIYVSEREHISED